MELTYTPFVFAADQYVSNVVHDGSHFFAIPNPWWTYTDIRRRILRSTDGESWEISQDISAAATYSIENMSLSAKQNVLIVHARFMNPASSGSVCILRSTDHGDSLTETFSAPLLSPMIAYNHSRETFTFYTRPRNIFSPEPLTFYESIYGETWNQKGTISPAYPETALPHIFCTSGTGRMFVQGFGISDDGGATWQHTGRHYIGSHVHDFLRIYEDDPESPYPYGDYWDWDYVASDEGMYMFFERWQNGISETWAVFSEDGNGWQEFKCGDEIQDLLGMKLYWIPWSAIMVNIYEPASGDQYKQLLYSKNGQDWFLLYDTQNMAAIRDLIMRQDQIFV